MKQLGDKAEQGPAAVNFTQPPAEGAQKLETGFPGLDVIRFSAALMVALYHFTYVGPDRLGPQGAELLRAFAPAQPITASLWIAVQIFFVLSGIVIAFSAQGRSAAEFLRRRALRLYPAAIICATITLALWPKPEWPGRYVRSITLWPIGPWVSDVYWTLAVEVGFYALVALALAIRGQRGVMRLGDLLVLAGASWWLLRIVNFAAGDPLRPLIDGIQSADPLLILNNCCFFGLGMILYEWRARGSSRRSAALIFIAVTTCLAAVISTWRGFGFRSAETIVATPPAIWLFALILMVLALGRGGRRQRQSPVIRQIGLATYPLYLVHAEVGIALMLLLQPIGAMAALAMALVGVLLLVTAILFGEQLLRRAMVHAFSRLGSFTLCLSRPPR